MATQTNLQWSPVALFPKLFEEDRSDAFRLLEHGNVHPIYTER